MEKKVTLRPIFEIERDIESYIEREDTASTWMIGIHIKCSTKFTRNIMKKMEDDGKVGRHGYSSKNNIVWQLI